ncbi:MFS general substrate transporter [Tilletiaria anomala UBC 951]|uniref:MFS general substrate transporter n=1 Tax=Tilletiaria anomala (strain ATCC 24038 / CBS 436.72 / UBC 951) TaxID=1037660 RepID=A0A066WFR5_TILAU|nr:MFS general substrate transporter [Tilletiaria anomala UBC 951]KDN52646.1 MFS general substrate transporter [Tilletiaria anomala UBC 951]
MSSNGASEREPLLSSAAAASTSPNRPSALSSTRPAGYDSIEDGDGAVAFDAEDALLDEEAVAQESAFAAIRDASHGVDPNSSAFAPPCDQSQFSINHSLIAGSAINASGIAVADGTAPDAAQPAIRSDVIVIMSAMWIGTFLAALDGTIVATILSTVGSEFRVSKEIGWLGTSYLLSQTGFQPLYGKASDLLGRKPATLFASAVFLIGSLLCGLSQTFWQLCAARAIAGIGGGGLTTMSTIVTSDLVPLKSRGTWQGLGNLVFATGAALGGPLGGMLADGGLGWRWAFLIQVPLCVVHFAVVFWKVDIPAGPGSMMEKIKRIDALGAITLVPSVTLILVALSLGGNEREWSDKLVLGSLFGGLGGAVLFVLVEKYVACEPLMPLRVLFRRTPGFVALTALFTSMSQFALLFSIPSYFAVVEQTSTSYAGLHLIPNSVLASACSLGSGLIMAHTGRYKTMLIIVAACGFVGPMAMATLWHRGHTSEFVYWASMPFGGIGFGGILTITLVALIASIDPRDMSAATGMVYLFRAIGSITGVSLSQAILQLRLQSTLSRAGLPSKIIRGIREDVNTIRTLPRGLREEAINAYGASLNTVFIGIFLTGFFAFLCTFAVEEHALPGSPTKPAPAAAASAQARPREQTIAEEEEEEN